MRLRDLAYKVRLRLADQYQMADLLRAQGATIGEGCRIMVRTLGSEPWLVTIGDQTLISSEVAIVTHDGATWAERDRHPNVNRFGRVTIGSRCFIGARAIILPGVTIGDRCIVGAGSVVVDDVPSGTVVAGVPAKAVNTTAEYIAKCERESIPDLPKDRAALRRVLERVL
jgi:acetyltransferase-like isoleucine patch superfamily enzyme